MKPQVLNNLSYGMYAIGVKDGKRPNACIVNTVMQISKATPSRAALVAVAMRHSTTVTQTVPISRHFRAPIFVMNFAPIRLPTNAKMVASMGPKA